MARFLIESPHTKEECLGALDEVLAKDPGLLNKFEWGCMSGKHIGMVVLDAESEDTAKKLLPPTIWSKAQVTRLNKFTPDEVRSFHK